MSEHFCQYVIKFPKTQDDGSWVRCDKPAGIKRNGNWVCAEHFDLTEQNSGSVFIRWSGE